MKHPGLLNVEKMTLSENASGADNQQGTQTFLRSGGSTFWFISIRYWSLNDCTPGSVFEKTEVIQSELHGDMQPHLGRLAWRLKICKKRK
jgi:hypothetical protein